MILNKTELINCMAKKGYTKKDAEFIIDDFIDVITEQLVEGNTIRIYGFGIFSVRDNAGREVVDLKTGEKINVPGYKSVKFAPGKTLKRVIKEGFIRE